MDITTFIAGLIAGIFIGRIRGRAQAAREAREWLEAQQSTVGGATPGADGTHECPVDTPFSARQAPLARHAWGPNP